VNYPILLLDYQDPNIGTEQGQTTTRTYTITGTPINNMAYIFIHLDFGLKHTEPFIRLPDGVDGLSNDAQMALNHPNYDPDNPVTIWDNSLYEFSAEDNAGGGGEDSIRKINEFKKLRGAVGFAFNSFENPLQGTTVEFYKKGELIGTIETDENGFYYIDYKHKGKPSDFTIKLPEYGLEYTEEMKANKFVVHVFNVP